MNNEQIYLRVLNDLPFMQEILKRADEQADEFAVEMLSKRIHIEREAVRLEEDRARTEAIERQRLIEEQREYKDDG